MAVTTRGWLTYGMDSGLNVAIKANSVTAAYNGQTLSKFPPAGQPFPYLRRDMRHLIGHSTTGKSARMTVCDETAYSAVTIGIDTFQDANGTTYTVSSKIGEKSNARDAR